MLEICLGILVLPLIAAIIDGLFGRVIGRTAAHCVAILAVFLSFVGSATILYYLTQDEALSFNRDLYVWAQVGQLKLSVGLLIDRLTALMMTVVTFVSLMVHVYTIGYMEEDLGYQRFFSYIALFTFAMLSLVMSNNFLQLFFGWEGVGVVSYLLIGFWFKRPTAIFANLKAFLVNRVGDFGFILGIAGVLMVFGTLDYQSVFMKMGTLGNGGEFGEFLGLHFSLMDFVCCLLFVGAMGKSAQIPLHIWLPDSMEGPTPISALIHAATMVTAGVFMVARLSPLFEEAELARSFILIIGATTCFFTGLLGLVQNDIKRIIAYSTLSQLGYMVTALGASAYVAGIFHLATHAFFKALLFLGAGSVIMAMHHEQDITRMGGLRRYLPITYITMLLGSLALIGFPFFSGFYSKDTIIELVHLSQLPGHEYASWAVTASVFVTALYSFRLLFLVFHAPSRIDAQTRSHLHEPRWVVTVPLILLAIPSVFIGAWMMQPLLEGYLAKTIFVHPDRNTLLHIAEHYEGAIAMALHGFTGQPFMLAMAGVLMAWLCYCKLPIIPTLAKRIFGPIYRLLQRKYGFDDFNQGVIMAGSRGLGVLLNEVGDRGMIDGIAVNGSAQAIAKGARLLKSLQSGYLYHYAFTLFVGFIVLLWWVWKS